MSRFLEREGDNLVNYFVLPLLKLSKTSFGKDNFINAYIGDKKDTLIVEVNSVGEELITALESNPNYATDLEVDGRLLILFNVPSEFKEDIDKFVVGKYSQFSDPAKALVRKYSQLKYKVVVKDPKNPSRTGTVTHAFLRALDKDTDLRKELEEYLGVKIDKEQELLGLPHEQNYYSLT